MAAGISGSHHLPPARLRDHVLGFEAVSGRAQRFVGGARVVKNVTGYDLPKLMAGSWRLAVLTQLTLKVMPLPRATATIALHRTRRSARRCGDGGGNALRPSKQRRRLICRHRRRSPQHLEGFAASVAARCTMLRALLPNLARLSSCR